MKRKRAPEYSESLPCKHMCIAEGKDEDTSEPSKNSLAGESSSECDSSNGSEASSIMQQLSLIQSQLPPFLYDIFDPQIFFYLSNRDLVNFSVACKQTHSWALQEREKRGASVLLLAVVQGNEVRVKHIANPGLVCSARGIATDYSERLFQGLTPFQAALCAGDVAICEIMKNDYFSPLKDGEAEMEKQFNAVFPNGIEAHVQIQQGNIFDFNEILEAIIHAQEDEVIAALNKAFDNNLPLHQALEKFRKAFTGQSLSEPVFNPYHLLRAFEVYNAKLGNFDNLHKRDLFFRQVIGFVQRYLPACTLQAFAQGLYYITQKNEPLRRSFKFKNGGGSILPSKNFSGLGFDFAAERRRGSWEGAAVDGEVRFLEPAFFEEMCQAKISSLKKLLSPIQQCKRELDM